MPVNPDDLLIFKMRKKEGAEEAEEAKAAPEAAATAAGPADTVPQQAAPAPSVVPQTAPPAPQENNAVEQKRDEAPRAKLSDREREAEQARQYEYLSRSGVAQSPMSVEAALGGKGAKSNLLTYIAGAIFLAGAAIFGYLIYTSSLFVVNDIIKVGLDQFMNTLSYEYEISLVNMVLVALSTAAGLLMFTAPEKSHKFGGVVIAFVILAVTFEYLNTNSADLLVVAIGGFFEMGVLAYASITASNRAAEREELRADEVPWPKIEAF